MIMGTYIQDKRIFFNIHNENVSSWWSSLSMFLNKYDCDNSFESSSTESKALWEMQFARQALNFCTQHLLQIQHASPNVVNYGTCHETYCNKERETYNTKECYCPYHRMC